MSESSEKSLEEYRRKRDFSRTPEPSGEEEHEPRNIFVVQKHHATHLHYDFRLRLHGGLKSWALAKAPSFDPSQHRIANETEDHPLEYAAFEGVIPEGEYGAGTVLIWDQGEWEPLDEGKQGYYKGRLHFKLHGKRLRGGWFLVREEKGSRQWLLMKEEDQFASSGDTPEEAVSVTTGRTMAEIAADPDRMWTREKGLAFERGERTFGHSSGGSLPSLILAQSATLSENVPQGDDWLHEIKYDGYRIVCRIDKEGSGVHFYTRKGTRFTDRLPLLRQAVLRLPLKQGWLDGVMVVFTSEGKSDFHALQNAFTRGSDSKITYAVFDIMNYEGFDIRRVPLLERKALLAGLIPAMERIRYVDHVIGHGEEFYREACFQKLEGVLSKKVDSEYVSARTRTWLKVKCITRQEFVVGG